jgi:hypothetical protein
MATLVRLSDVLLPPIGDQPGALQAETPTFLDFLIGASPAPRKKVYTDGLDWLDSESQKRYRKAFAKLDNIQADAILKPWLRTWMTDHPPLDPHADFVNIVHNDIRRATVNSKAWSDAPTVGAQASSSTGLYWYPIEPDLHARSLPTRVTDAPKSSHTTPSYPQ